MTLREETAIITPETLREIADSLEQDPENGRTIETLEGTYVTLQGEGTHVCSVHPRRGMLR